MGSSFCKYSRKTFANWFVKRSLMIHKRERFVFWIRESQTNKTTTIPLNIQAFLSTECTEEHHFQEVFDHYRINVFFALLYLASGCRSCKALQNRFWTSCGWPWPFRFLQCQIYGYETQFTTWCFKLHAR